MPRFVLDYLFLSIVNFFWTLTFRRKGCYGTTSVSISELPLLVYSKVAHMSFLRFIMKLERLKVQKFARWIFQENSHFGEKALNSSKIGFFGFCLKLYRYFFIPKVVYNSVYDSTKMVYLGKFGSLVMA